METILLVVLAFVFLFGVLIVSHFQSKRWLEKWPPIDDGEFMARCEPGISREVALKVRRIVSEQLGVDYEQVHPDQNFVEDLGCD